MNNKMIETLSRFKWLWRKRQHRMYALSGTLADPLNGQGRIIALLKIRDGISSKDMTYLLGIHFSTLTELIGKLEKNGYVIREQSPDDKRIPLVWLTEKGKAVEQDKRSNGDISGVVIESLNESEQETFCGYLDRINTALQEELGINTEEVSAQMQEWNGHRKHRRLHDCNQEKNKRRNIDD